MTNYKPITEFELVNRSATDQWSLREFKGDYLWVKRENCGVRIMNMRTVPWQHPTLQKEMESWDA